MRGSGRVALGAVLLVAGTLAAAAESGSLFKNLFGGGGGGGAETPSLSAPKAQDPEEAYCPTITVMEGGSALQAFAGAAGDNTRLRHQVVFGAFSRECTAREGGAVAVKVGVQLRALLGPAGASGTFDTPVTIAITYNEKQVTARTRRVAVTVPAGAAQGTASVIESDLVVPADMATGYDIEIGLGSHTAGLKAPPKVAAKHRKPATAEAADGAATSMVPAFGQ